MYPIINMKATGIRLRQIMDRKNITSRDATHNVGRLRLKRYLSVMANQRLREKYFDF